MAARSQSFSTKVGAERWLADSAEHTPTAPAKVVSRSTSTKVVQRPRSLQSLEPACPRSLPICWCLRIGAYHISVLGGDWWRSVHRAFQLRLVRRAGARFCFGILQWGHGALQLRFVRRTGALLTLEPACSWSLPILWCLRD